MHSTTGQQALPLAEANVFAAVLSMEIKETEISLFAAEAQSVKRPELRSLKEVQLSHHEFDSRLRHRS